MMQSQTTATPKLFIGMDIHKKTWSVHFRTDLFDHKGFSMPPVAEKLFDSVSLHFAGHEVSLTYEADVVRSAGEVKYLLRPIHLGQSI